MTVVTIITITVMAHNISGENNHYVDDNVGSDHKYGWRHVVSTGSILHERIFGRNKTGLTFVKGRLMGMVIVKSLYRTCYL